MKREPGRTYTVAQWAERERRGASQRGTLTLVLMLSAPFFYAGVERHHGDGAGLLAGSVTLLAGVAVSWRFFAGRE